MLKAIPRIILIKSLLLGDFPSGSSINYHDGRFYLVGDDANKIAVLDHHYRQVDSIGLFDYPEKRIPKASKTDFEAAVIVDAGHQAHLLAIGSASRKEREKGMLVPLAGTAAPSSIDLSVFTDRLRKSGIREVNIEGATTVGDQIILANRGNHTHPENHLIITAKDYWLRQQDAPVTVLPLALPPTEKGFAGISELCYVPAVNSLLFTFSSEATANAYDDGVIGDSYIGWVSGISGKLGQSVLTPDGMINLSETDAAFKGEKIEGICLEKADGKELLLHLVADNDQGQSRLFKVRMIMDNNP